MVAFLQDMNHYEVIWSSSENKTMDEELEVKQSCFVMEVKSDSLLNYFSLYDKLLRAIAWWLKYINYLKLKAKGEDVSSLNKELSVDEFKQLIFKLLPMFKVKSSKTISKT